MNCTQENYAVAAVKRELRKAGGRMISGVRTHNRDDLEFWQVGKRLFIVQIYADDNGVEVWKPVTPKNGIDDVIKAMKL